VPANNKTTTTINKNKNKNKRGLYIILHIHACFGTLPDTKIVKLLSQVVLKGVNGRLPLTIVDF